MPVAPHVSVLIPTYNGARFVAETIRSVLDQTYSDFELIVGDDGSADATVEIVRDLTYGDPRAQVLVYDRNIGSFNSVNRLYALARGTYVKYLLQDDLLAPTAIETFVRALDADSRIVLATSRRTLIDEHGGVLPDGPHSAPITTTAGVIDGRELGNFVLANMLNVIGELSTALFRRGLELGAPALSIDTREMVANGDIALWLKLLAHGDAFYTPEPLSSFRQHAEQCSRDEDVWVGGLTEWPVMVDRARALGFLADPALERSAHARIAPRRRRSPAARGRDAARGAAARGAVPDGRAACRARRRPATRRATSRVCMLPQRCGAWSGRSMPICRSSGTARRWQRRPSPSPSPNRRQWPTSSSASAPSR